MSPDSGLENSWRSVLTLENYKSNSVYVGKTLLEDREFVWAIRHLLDMSYCYHV